jgi:hypothetical protein
MERVWQGGSCLLKMPSSSSSRRLPKLARALCFLQLSLYAHLTITIFGVRAATQATGSSKAIISPNPIIIGKPYTFAVESPVDAVRMEGPDDADFTFNDDNPGDKVNLDFQFVTPG